MNTSSITIMRRKLPCLYDSVVRKDVRDNLFPITKYLIEDEICVYMNELFRERCGGVKKRFPIYSLQLKHVIQDEMSKMHCRAFRLLTTEFFGMFASSQISIELKKELILRQGDADELIMRVPYLDAPELSKAFWRWIVLEGLPVVSAHWKTVLRGVKEMFIRQNDVGSVIEQHEKWLEKTSKEESNKELCGGQASSCVRETAFEIGFKKEPLNTHEDDMRMTYCLYMQRLRSLFEYVEKKEIAEGWFKETDNMRMEAFLTRNGE